MQKQESTIYLAFYRTVDDEVAKYAKAKGLKLVLRQQDSSLDENQPLAELLKSLNRSIIYQDGLDITDEILKALDARAAQQALSNFPERSGTWNERIGILSGRTELSLPWPSASAFSSGKPSPTSRPPPIVRTRCPWRCSMYAKVYKELQRVQCADARDQGRDRRL